MKSLQQLEEVLTEPSAALVADLATLDGDLLILGAGGKMGPSLAVLAKKAFQEAGVAKRIIGMSRFSDDNEMKQLEARGIETIMGDLLDDEQLAALPDVKNVIYMAGNKFGTTGNEHFSWAMNTYLPGKIAEKYKNSRIVAFSTGNVYPLTPVKQGGATENDPTGPIGEYAQSCLGRERIFEHFSRKYGTPLTIFRLNYAIDLRYGVLLEVAKAVKSGQPIDLSMGHVNVIWQGDANEMALRALTVADTPPCVLNIAGPETISVRWLAEQFGNHFGTKPHFVNEEQETALLNNASKAHQLFGYPRVTLRQMIDWVAAWVQADGPTHDKPTHFQERQGAF